jgi:chaperone modulatory protein CbpM
MAIEASDWTWLDPQRRVDQLELAQMCSLTVVELDELVDYGALVPLATEIETVRQFSASCVPPLREAARLRTYYDLDLFTVSLLLGYLQRIAHLEQQLRGLQAHLPHPAHLPREGPTPWREPHA